jgi:hypothetical protein
MTALMSPLKAALLPLAELGTEYILFGIAGLISAAAFGGLILAPALGAFSRGWEKFAAGVLSLFVLAALVLVGLAIGLVVFYNWDEISKYV